MTFGEAEVACQQVTERGEKLLESSSREDAKDIEQKCRYYIARMHGRFGNVAEQFSRVITAAKMYQKSRVDVGAASSNLHTTLTRVRGAILIHRNADRTRWGE